MRRRAIGRLNNILLRAGLIGHPWGREYVKEHYTWTGKFVGGDRER